MFSLMVLLMLVLHSNGECDKAGQAKYRGICISRDCLVKKLPKMSVIDQSYQRINQISNDTYNIMILYPDDKKNQLVSDPTNCIDWRVYQISGPEDKQQNRKYVQNNSLASKPAWPKPVYKFQNDMAVISFNITKEDLVKHECQLTYQQEMERWECFFEFGFVLQSKTQVSYFFSTVLSQIPEVGEQQDRKGDGTTTAIATMTQGSKNLIYECPKDGSDPRCYIHVVIESVLTFCKDQNCEETNRKPFRRLTIQEDFYMKHEITNPGFRKSWIIEQPKITFNSKELNFELNMKSDILVSQGNGYNVYKLNVPLATENVLITAAGVIQQNKRILEEKEEGELVKGVIAQAYTGKIIWQLDSCTYYLIGVSLLIFGF